MKRGSRRGKVPKKGTMARARNKEESKQDETELQEDEMFSEAVQGNADNALALTDEELDADIERILTPANTQAASNISYFSFKDRVFKKAETNENLIVHFSMDGNFLLTESEEASKQEEFIENKNMEADSMINASAVEEESTMDKATQLKALRNQFNYAERTSQSFTIGVKERGVSTQRPPSRNFAGSVTQWDIYDSFMSELELNRAAEKANGKAVSRREDPMFSSELNFALKIMERMVNQNKHQYTYHTYKYLDLVSDQVRSNEGSLNELWTFTFDKANKKEVTALSWNPKYHDMFAAGFGSYSFNQKTTGLICCYSLKNTRHPEYVFSTPQGVMCLDWHPQHPALLAVGLYDGTVLVFDVRSKQKKPIYQSTVRTNKHTDPVWQVKWLEEDVTKNLSFFSISSDGRVTNWVLMKNKLEPEEVIKLKLVSGQREGEEDDTALSGLAGGTCFDFNPFYEHLFIVGTEEGKIHKCNKMYSGQYLETYEGHFMAVYSLKWNKFHPNIFLSSSADWTVKMWEHTSKTALLTFDLGIAVGDIAWAPYSSTVFSAITADSKCHVYDVAEDKLSEKCEKKVLNSKLNHIAFNPTDPVIIIGNDKGQVKSFKLSPNLRKQEEPTEEEAEQGKTTFDKERQKIEDVLNSIDRTVY